MRGTFANTINELGNHAVLSTGDCHNFGITWGCRVDCPAFQKGNCKDVYFDNLKQFIQDGEIYNDDEFLSYLMLYHSKLTDSEINELFNDWFSTNTPN